MLIILKKTDAYIVIVFKGRKRNELRERLTYPIQPVNK